MFIKKITLAVALATTAASAFASRTVTDQLDRTVTIPDEIHRAVVLQHQTLNIANQLDAMDQIVGVLSSWEKQLGSDYLRLDPVLKNMPTPGDLTSVNIESLLKLKPDVVFVANYAPKEMIDQISAAGIPVIGISLRVAPKDQVSKLNPTLKDDRLAYSEGLKQGIELIANVFNRQKAGKELIEAAFANQKLLNERVGGIPADKRVRSYMANPDLVTYGSGKFTGVFFEEAGAYNVAAPFIKGYKTVGMEDVLKWNPEVILVQNRYPKQVSVIKNDPNWAPIKAVKDGRIYYMPQYAKAWGYPQPEAMALGELWLAKKLYPQKFTDINMEKLANDYYLKFYRVPYIANAPAQ